MTVTPTRSRTRSRSARGRADGPSARRPSAGVSATSARRFARRAWSRRLLSLRPLLVAVLVAGVAAALVWAALWSSLLSVHQVRVEGVSRLDPQQVLRAADVPVGRSMLRLDAGAVAERVRRLAPVASVDVQRRWPSTVALVVTERRPVAALAEGDHVRLVDGAGVAFATAPTRPARLPLVTGVAASDVGPLRAAATVAAGLPAGLASQVTSVSAASPDDVVLHLTHGRTAVWGDATGGQEKAAVLAVLLRTQKAPVYDVSAPAAPTTHR